jgi:tetratricopeptide (TPR) repeat protein
MPEAGILLYPLMTVELKRRMKRETKIKVAASGECLFVSTRCSWQPLTTKLLSILLVIVATGIGCHSKYSLPERSSTQYSDYVSSFYVGLAALQVGDDVRADNELAKSTRLVPGEPAGWGNWGILALRQRNYDDAAQRLEQAKKLAPQNDSVYYLLGLLEAGRGRSTQAIANYRKAVVLNPGNLIALYQLAQEVERQGDPGSDDEFQKLMQQILQQQPENLAAMLELSRIAAKRGDIATLRHAVASVGAHSKGWPMEIQKQLTELQAAAGGPDPHAAAVRTTFLRNVLMRTPDFRQSLATLKPPPGEEAKPFLRFLRLENPVFTPAPPDVKMTFDVRQIENRNGAKWNWVGAVSLTGVGTPTIVQANGSAVQIGPGVTIPFPGGAKQTIPGVDGVVPVDFNYDFKMDLVLVGAGGLRFIKQDNPNHFVDVTAKTGLAGSLINGDYAGGWAIDIDADGDLDILIAPSKGSTFVLRNNGDGTFTPVSTFAGISGVKGFVWADLNGDGNPDASFIDGTDQLRIFTNERSGRFSEISSPSGAKGIRAITAADASHRGVLDLLAVRDDGSVLRISEDKGAWNVAKVTGVPEFSKYQGAKVRLYAADLDNNGAIDLLLAPTSSGSAEGNQEALLWLGSEKGEFTTPVKVAAPNSVFGVVDLNKDGRLDILGLTSDGLPSEALNHGTRDYHWQVIQPRAKQAVGDQRINSFGIGGEIEIRSGLLVQMQPINSPQVHFGLGEQNNVDVARILWPNGSMRAEFALKADQEIVTEQRLKGSCPFLFAYDGKRMSFVKDAVPWGSAIGLRINNIGTASIAATEEWYKIGRDELAPHDGYYDLRITGELWETYYYDYLSLMAVDHPAGTEIYTDERFVIPAVKSRVIALGESHKISRAIDDTGTDVTGVVRDLDNNYLDTFGRGQYQGVTRDHYVEIDLAPTLPSDGPLYIVAKGWLHPSDSSVNVAMGQGRHDPPHALSLEVPDGRGGWVVARRNLGFPAGRKKICLLDITGVFRPNTPKKVRLRTNLEIYWDSIEWAQGLPNTSLKVTKLSPAVADLHYRGYSVIHQANNSSPEIPDYAQLASTKQTWRDLSGYYTRFGDVRELLAGVDDRYVIMNAGDEISLRFPVLPDPPAGWVRDYVIAGDGWIKDGDYNSTYSRTVQPLPHHDQKTYDVAPGELEDEWTYRKHEADWQHYHTRYVTQDEFRQALRSN